MAKPKQTQVIKVADYNVSDWEHYEYIGEGSYWYPACLTDLLDKPGETLQQYEQLVRHSPFLMARLATMSNKYLGCTCTQGMCHGDTLVRLIEEIQSR